MFYDSSILLNKYLLIACLLLASVAQAQEITPPSREDRQGMSYEEYSAIREKMRSRMEKMHQEGTHSQDDKPDGNTERRADGTYGQGIGARNRTENPRETLRERPRFERMDRFERRGR